MCLLVPVETTAIRSLQSLLRVEDDDCYGSLLQIHFNGATAQAKYDGTSTGSLTTRKSQ